MKTKSTKLLAMLSVLALLVSLFSVTVLVSHAEDENLLSSGLVSLSSRIDNGGGYTVQDLIDNDRWYGWGDRLADTEIGHNGKPSMKVSKLDSIGANAHDYAFVKLPAGTYAFSAWIKTDNYQSATTALDVDIFDVGVLDKTAELNDLSANNPPTSHVANNVFYDQNSQGEFSTADWTQYSVEFTLTAESVVRLHFGSQYSWGTIWASDFALKAVEKKLLNSGLANLTSRIDNGGGYTVQDLIDNDRWYGWGDRLADTEIGHNGKPSMKVSKLDSIGANAHDYAFVKLPAGTYAFSAWIKTDAYQSATTALDVDIFDVGVLDKTAELNDLGANNPPTSHVTNNVFYDQSGQGEFSTADWTQYSVEFTLTAESVVRLHFGSTYSWGTIWASDFAVTAVEKEEEEEQKEPEVDPTNLLSAKQVYVSNRQMNVSLSTETAQDIIDNGIWYGWGEQLFDEETGHDGKPSMKGSAASIGANSQDYTFVHLPAGNYEFSAWVKTDKFQAASMGLNLEVYGLDILGAAAKLEEMEKQTPTLVLKNLCFSGMNDAANPQFSTADWTQHSLRFTLEQESIVRLNVAISHFQGAIWVSDFALKVFEGDINEGKYEEGNLLTKKVVNLEQWMDNSPDMGTVDFLLNNDFWYGWGTNGSIDEENGHDGKPSQKVYAAILGGNMNRYVYAKLEPGSYRFSAWIKTDEFCGNALHLGARVFENDIGNKSAELNTLSEELSTNFLNKYINATHVDDIYSTEDWKEVAIDFIVTGDTAKYVRLSVEAGHFEGTAWISDFRLATRKADPESSDPESSDPADDDDKPTKPTDGEKESSDTDEDEEPTSDNVDTGVTTAIPAALMLLAISSGAVLTLSRKKN